VAEIFFALIVGTLILRGQLKPLIKTARIGTFLKLLTACQFGQLVSDIHNHTSFVLMSKGFLLVFFTGINLIAITSIIRFEVQRYLIAVSLYSVSYMLSYLFQPRLFEDANPWKFGFGYPLTAIYFCYLTHKSDLKPRTLLFLSILLGSVDFTLGARNLAGVTILAGAFSCLARSRNLNKSKVLNENGLIKRSNVANSRSLAGLLIIIFTLGLLLNSIYSHAAKAGLLGVEAAEKLRNQTSTGTNLLFTSRSEVFSEYLAIRESPIIGHGSYAPLTDELRAKLLPWLQQNRLQTNLTQLESGINYMIPVHSGLLAFWVWFGFLAVPLFLFLLWKAVTTLRSRIELPIVYFYSILTCWDILFSPFGMYARIQYPLVAIGLFVFAQEKKENE
jgi:hypothetical protein